MEKIKRRLHYIFRFVVVLVIVFSLVPGTRMVAYAESTTCNESGHKHTIEITGEGENKTLTIYATGKNKTINSYCGLSGSEGIIQSNGIKKVVIEGFEIINSLAFKNCSGLTSITIPDSVTTIKESVFLDVQV